MDSSLAPGLLSGLASAVLFGLGAVAQAAVVRRMPPSARLLTFVRRGLRSPGLLAVVAAYLAGFVLHAVSIWLLPLYLAQSLVSFSLPVTAVATRLLGEHVPARTWAAVSAVVVGLTLLARGSGQPGPVATSPAFTTAVVTCALALALVVRRSHVWSGAALGWSAGLGYAGSAVAVRGVGWPLDAATLLVAACVPLFGLLAFWLYSSGLARSSVATSTAPLVATQTFLPALVGLALLGDEVAAGGWPLVATGFVTALLGAMAAGRAGAPVLPEPATGRTAG